MDGIKGILQSRTIWALAVNAACQGLKLKGFDVGDAEQAAAVTFLLNAVDFGTLVLAAYYRWTATKKLSAAPVEKTA